MKTNQIKLAIEAATSRVGFERAALDMRSLSFCQKQALRTVPAPGSRCRVKLQPNAKSSAYGQMWEYAVVAGFMQGQDDIKALVIFTEREDADTNEYDWSFVAISQLREFKPERVRKFRF
jgi:hypothetical protein